MAINKINFDGIEIEIPRKTSQLENDAGFITADDLPSGEGGVQVETDPTVPSYVKNITELDIQNWNSKSDFSGDYNDLTNKPDIPSTEGLATTQELENTASSTLDSAKVYTDEKVANLVGTAPETLDTLQEVATAIQENDTVVQALNSAIGNKVDKVTGKGLSTNDYTTAEKEKLAGLENYNDTSLSNRVTAVENNKADRTELFSGNYEDLTNKPEIPNADAFVSQGEFSTLSEKVDGKVDISVTDSDNNFASNPEITSDFLRKGLGFLVKVTSDGFGDEYQLGYGVGDGSVGNSLGKFQVLEYPEAGGCYVVSTTPYGTQITSYNTSNVYGYNHQLDQYGYHLALTYSGTSSSIDPKTVHHMTRDGYWINEDAGHGSVAMSGTGLNKTGVLIQDVWLKKDSSGNLTWNGNVMAKKSDIPSVPTDYVNLSSAQTVGGDKTFTGAIIVPDVTIT